MTPSDQLVGVTNLMMMSEFDALKKILAYVARNRLKADLEVNVSHIVVGANELEIFYVGERINIELKPHWSPCVAPLWDLHKYTNTIVVYQENYVLNLQTIIIYLIKYIFFLEFRSSIDNGQYW